MTSQVYKILIIIILIFLLLIPKKDNFTNLEKDIYVELEGGLSNKVRTLVGFNYLAKKQNKKLYAIWEYSSECPCNFSDLFENMKNTKILYKKNKPKTVYDYGVLNDFICKNHNMKNGEHLQNYKNLKIKKNILNKVNNFIKNNNMKNYLGLHIRRTDHTDYLLRTNKKHLIRDNLYYENQIQKFNKSYKNDYIYLATDNFKTQEYFSNKFDNIIFYKTISKNSKLRQTSCEEALIDILILTKCSTFIGTDYSSFTNFIKTLRKHYPNIINNY